MLRGKRFPVGSVVHDILFYTIALVVGITAAGGYLLNFGVLVYGLVLSIKNRLTAKKTGWIMATSYAVIVISIVMQFIDMKIKNNGNFCYEEKRLHYFFIRAICVLSLGEILYGIKMRFSYITDLGLVVTTVHGLGRVGLVIILGYQAYVLNSKRKKALKIVVGTEA